MATSVVPIVAGSANVGTDNGCYARGDHVHPAQPSVSGNAGTASKLATARSISLSTGATATGSFDGSANLVLSVTALNANYITSGVVGIEFGGTGASTVAAARNNLGLGNTSGAVPVANGGTGATNAATARTNLGAAAAVHAHSASSDITTGTLPVARGGTGQNTLEGIRGGIGLGYTTGVLNLSYGGTGGTTAAAARNNLGLGNTSGPVPVENGGTGASTPAAALTKLGIFYAATLPTTGVEGQICLVPIS